MRLSKTFAEPRWRSPNATLRGIGSKTQFSACPTSQCQKVIQWDTLSEPPHTPHPTRHLPIPRPPLATPTGLICQTMISLVFRVWSKSPHLPLVFIAILTKQKKKSHPKYFVFCMSLALAKKKKYFCTVALLMIAGLLTCSPCEANRKSLMHWISHNGVMSLNMYSVVWISSKSKKSFLVPVSTKTIFPNSVFFT